MILDKEINLLLEEYKAENIISLDVKNKSSVTDTMIICLLYTSDAADD